MHDLKILEVTAMPGLTIAAADLQSQVCHDAFHPFARNVTRVVRMIEAPIFAALTADRRAAAQNFVFEELFGTIHPSDEQIKGSAEVFGSLMDQKMGELINIGNDAQKQLMLAMAHNLGNFITNVGGEIHAIFESLLKAIIMQSWTAFEVLTEDLWERALNAHPNDLSQVTFPDRDKKGVDVATIQERGFDLSQIMGTMLKAKFRFHTLNDIRLAYTSAFSTDGGAVGSAIRDGSIDALYHLRNLIAHNSGVIDAHFLDETKGVAKLKTIRAVGENNPIPFDGDIVKEFSGEGIRCGCALIKSVDEWLIAHPA